MLFIDKYSSVPIYLQVMAQFEELIFADVLKAEDLLPSVRALAKDLGINPNTLQRAYTEMENQGICLSVPGSGRYVAQDAKTKIAKKKQAGLGGLKEIVIDAKKSGSTLEDILAIVRKAYEEV